MNVAEIFLRALDTNGAVYMPYEFSGEWREEDKALIDATIRQYVPDRVDAGFNNWRFLSDGSNWFYAVRATWEVGCLSASSADELSYKIVEYYTR